MTTGFRYYQQEADEAIFEELQENNKCLVKMFCGTGKSRLMRYCRIAQNKKLVVYVVPSLSLLEQFYADYLQDFPLVQRISSEEGSTTETVEIVNFLKQNANKIICVTYQSFETLIHLLGDIKIDVCIFDEAHHVVGKTYQTLIFESDVCEKQVFFTATPKNANGVIMYDKDNLDSGMCGKLVYDYSYFRGAMEGYLNPFEIRLDFYTENTNMSVYESIARAILSSGNSRVLTFHADVNGDRDASVLRFVDEQLFIVAFNKVLVSEFPDKTGVYTNVKMVVLSASINMRDRKRILKEFDETPDNEAFIISSCQTIGEGIDTKNANMCVFVDPKSSFVAITQNIGRIVRKNPDILKPNSTILIPCWVDKEKYLGCDGDKDKCDEVIREDMNKEGNFNGILNVMSALKQESEDLFDACLNYPSTYSPQEIEGNLSKHGYRLEEPVTLVESLEHLLDVELEIDLDEDETDEDMLLRVAEENNVTIEVHSNSLETPIEYYNEDLDEGKEVIRIFKSEDEETEEVLYQPIVKKDGSKRNTDTLDLVRRDNRFNVKVHTNPDVKVLWNLSSDLDLSRDICSCIIDCEVVDIWPQRFEELKAFIDENERRPSNHSKNLEEKTLANWVSTQITNYKNNKMNTLRSSLWIQFLEEYKKYFVSNDEKWMQQFEELKAFIDKNQHLPHYKTFIGLWYKTQQSNYKKKTQCMKNIDTYTLWSEFIKIYADYLHTIESKWYTKFEELKQFIVDNKRRPNTCLKEECEEKYIGQWYNTQKTNYKTKTRLMKIPQIYNDWTQFKNVFAEFIEIENRYEKWEQNFKDLKTFIKTNKRRPVRSITYEKNLEKWMCHQKTNYANKWDIMKEEKYSKIWGTFYEQNKQYLNKDEKWFQTLETLKDFIDINKNKPTNSKLNTWAIHNNKNYKEKTQNMSDNDIYNSWNDFIKNDKYVLFYGTDDDIWNFKLKQISNFIDTNQRIPSRINNEMEKEYYSWIANNKNYYKNNKSGMELVNIIRRQKWEIFINKYFVKKEEIDTEIIKNEEIEIIVKPKQKKSAKLTKINPNPIKKEDTKEDILIRTKPLISQFHNKFCKMRSDNLAQHFQQKPSDFAEYHRVRDECFQTFEPEGIPYNRVIAELNKIKKGGKHIVDMGCGTAKIAEHFKEDPRFQITSYDHVAINNTVQVCDISHMPLDDNSVDICVMSLALWGSNCEEYIQEALRVLDENGILYIIDSTKRWSDEGMQDAGKLKTILEANGFQIKEKDTRIDKWCYFKCVK